MSAAKGGPLTTRIESELRRQIQEGLLQPGERLPPEKDMASNFGVSRTVIREAVAALRSEDLLISRHGVGVFVNAASSAGKHGSVPFDSAVLDALEIRMAVEVHAAGLAAARRSWAQEERIFAALESMRTAIETGASSEDADLSFHLSIAEAANNRKFVDFLVDLGKAALPRRALPDDDSAQFVTREYLEKIFSEHRLICAAISRGSVEEARAAMSAHLGEAFVRYRALNFPDKG